MLPQEFLQVRPLVTIPTHCQPQAEHRAPDAQPPEPDMAAIGLRIANAIASAVYGPKGEGR